MHTIYGIKAFLSYEPVYIPLGKNNDIEKASSQLREHQTWRIKNLPINKECCLNELMKGKIYHTHIY